MKFAVGYKLNGKTGHVIVDAEDALIAALRVKAQRPSAAITYARRQNKRGDARHPDIADELASFFAGKAELRRFVDAQDHATLDAGQTSADATLEIVRNIGDY